MIMDYMRAGGWDLKGSWGTYNLTTTCRTTGITIATDILAIEEVYLNYSVSNTNNWVQAIYIPASDLPHPEVNANDQFGQSNPHYWFLDYKTMIIDPQPDTQQVSGIKVKINTIITDLSADSDEPVFYEGCHLILAIGAALDYCLVKKPERVADLKNQLNDLILGRGGLRDVYMGMISDRRTRIIPPIRRCL